MEEQWYYSQQGQRMGPVSEEQLTDLVFSGQLKPTDMVWKKGMASWQAASQIPGLFPFIASDKPPPLPLDDTQPLLAESEGPIQEEHAPPPLPVSPELSLAGLYGNPVKQPPLMGVGIALIANTILPLLLSCQLIVHCDDHAGAFFLVMSFLQNGLGIVGGVMALRRTHYSGAVGASLLACLAWIWLSYYDSLITTLFFSVISATIGFWSFMVLRRPESRQQFNNQVDLVQSVGQWALPRLPIHPLEPTQRNLARAIFVGLVSLFFVLLIVASLFGPPSDPVANLKWHINKAISGGRNGTPTFCCCWDEGKGHKEVYEILESSQSLPENATESYLADVYNSGRKYYTAKYTVDTDYDCDVRKTDSLISPLVAIVTLHGKYSCTTLYNIDDAGKSYPLGGEHVWFDAFSYVYKDGAWKRDNEAKHDPFPTQWTISRLFEFNK